MIFICRNVDSTCTRRLVVDSQMHYILYILLLYIIIVEG